MVDCQRLALAVLMAATAMTGRPDEALLHRLDGLPRGVGFQRENVAIARAWLAAAQGRPGGARAELAEAWQDAASSGAVVTQAWILHERLRLGERSGVHRQLLALGLDSPFARAREALARGIETGDVCALAAAAAGFEEVGSPLYAAEAYAELGRAASGRDAVRARRRAQELAAQVGGPATPLLAGTAPDPLSPRERQVAERAAAGESNAEIAAGLHLSVRTVENHLAHAYAKLGIESRTELAAVVSGAAVEDE